MKLSGKVVAVLGLAVLLVLVSAMDASAGRGGGGRGGRGGRGGQGGRSFFGGGGGSTLLTVVRRSDVQKELELVPAQKESLDKIASDYSSKAREAFRGLFSRGGRGGRGGQGGGNNRQAAFQKIREEMKKLAASTDKEIGEVLLPHQAKRANELATQYTVSTRQSRAFTSGSLSEKLKVTDAQKEALRKKAEELNKELQKKVAKLRAESLQKLIGTLTPAQQKQYKAMSGKPFTFESTRRRFTRGGRGGRGGGRGGRGGERRRPSGDN